MYACLTGGSENERPASTEQVEGLQVRATNLSLQLRKQVDNNAGNISKMNAANILLTQFSAE